MEVRGHFAFNGDIVSRSWMNELKMPGMKSDASNSPLRRFCRMILSVSDHRMADRRKLHPYLVLQACHQRNSDERSGTKGTLNRILKFSASSRGIPLGGQLLKHSFTTKIVNECSFFDSEMPAHDSEILPYRSMTEKLSNEADGVSEPLTGTLGSPAGLLTTTTASSS